MRHGAIDQDLQDIGDRRCLHPHVRHLDLFSGIGGFALAARMVGGIETVGFCEIDPWAQKVLAKNFPGVPIHDDVKTLEGNEYGRIDLISGGYPCQPFSHAGYRKGSKDDRHLWPEMRRIIESARPRWVVAENVDGHVSLGLDQVLSELEAIGYTSTATVIPACAVDAQHRRDRVWVMGYSGYDEQEKHKSDDCEFGEWPKVWRGQQFVAGIAPDGATQSRVSAEGNGRNCPACLDGKNGEIRRTATRWLPEPGVDRVVDGIPSRMDKNRERGLGNAIVPQVAAEILRCMMRVDSLANK